MSPNLFSKISHINLYSKDHAKLIAFYRDTVGIDPQPNQDETQGSYVFATQGVAFAIEPLSNKELYPFPHNTSNPTMLQFKAENAEMLEAMNQQLEKNGVILFRRSEVVSYGTVTNFADPDGNMVEIVLEKQ